MTPNSQIFSSKIWKNSKCIFKNQNLGKIQKQLELMITKDHFSAFYTPQKRNLAIKV